MESYNNKNIMLQFVTNWYRFLICNIKASMCTDKALYFIINNSLQIVSERSSLPHYSPFFIIVNSIPRNICVAPAFLAPGVILEPGKKCKLLFRRIRYPKYSFANTSRRFSGESFGLKFIPNHSEIFRIIPEFVSESNNFISI